MKRKAVASLVLSVASICAQTVALSHASSGAIIVAQNGRENRSLATVSGGVSAVAIVLAVLALPLAINSWRQERAWVRISALCLAMGALVWSLVIV